MITKNRQGSIQRSDSTRHECQGIKRPEKANLSSFQVVAILDYTLLLWYQLQSPNAVRCKYPVLFSTRGMRESPFFHSTYCIQLTGTRQRPSALETDQYRVQPNTYRRVFSVFSHGGCVPHPYCLFHFIAWIAATENQLPLEIGGLC